MFEEKSFHNKTFFKDEYIGSNDKKIYVPRYSYFKEECCMWSATFYSLRSKKSLDRKIKKYLDGFTYFEDDTTYGYQKKDLFIQLYEVEDLGLIRRIIIVY